MVRLATLSIGFRVVVAVVWGGEVCVNAWGRFGWGRGVDENEFQPGTALDDMRQLKPTSRSHVQSTKVQVGTCMYIWQERMHHDQIQNTYMRAISDEWLGEVA